MEKYTIVMELLFAYETLPSTILLNMFKNWLNKHITLLSITMCVHDYTLLAVQNPFEE